MFDRKTKTQIKRYCICVLGSLVLFGCAQLPENVTNVEWQQHQQQLVSLEHYQAVGKLGFISPDERRSMSFQWKQAGNNTQLRLSSPFGQTLLKIAMTPSQTTIDTYQGEHYQSADGEQLLYQLTGLIIPLNQLSYWIKGAINQGNHYTLLETNTLASQTSEVASRVWQVSYQRYTSAPYQDQELPLPSLMKLNQNEIKINLQVSKWTID